MDEFNRTGLGRLVESHLGDHCASYGYRYSDTILALFCVYLCDGDHIENITTILNKYLSTAPSARLSRPDAIARGLKELRAPSIACTSRSAGVFTHDPAMRLNYPLQEPCR